MNEEQLKEFLDIQEKLENAYDEEIDRIGGLNIWDMGEECEK